tara:strand:- start:785 stop:1468 length:684 start_codon:yes stop_codon:yes gene_type:complete
MARRMSPDEALDVAKQVVEENPGITREEMNRKAEELASMIRSGVISVARLPARLTQAAADAPIGVDTPMGPQGTPGYLRDKLELDKPRTAPKPMFGPADPTPEQMRAMSTDPYRPPSGLSVSPPITEYTMGQSAKLAEIRGQTAFDVGFREGLQDYQRMKMESENIVDDLGGSVNEANSARSSIMMGNETSGDIKRLGYAEAMEFAERQETMGEDKMLREAVRMMEQ